MKQLVPIFLILISTLCQAQITPIIDIQFSTSGPSPLDGTQVTTEGVVVASGEMNNLDAVFIQQEGESEWAGIQLKGSSGLINLKVGDKVLVDGTVRESGGMTTLDFITNISVVDTGIVIPPSKVDPAIFSVYSLQENEKYECMFIQLELPPDSIFVANQNPDAPGTNFGDYRLGADPSDPDTGCRVLAGRQTSTVFSSLNVSYVNSANWATNSGTMNVPVVVVETGDAFSAVRGILVYGFSQMRLLPRNNDDFNPGEISSGIHDQRKNQMKISFFPNPSFGELWLSFESEKNDDVQLNIYEISGRKVLSSALHIYVGPNRIYKSIASLKSGTYVVEVQGEKTWASGKFVKGGE